MQQRKIFTILIILLLVPFYIFNDMSEAKAENPSATVGLNKSQNNQSPPPRSSTSCLIPSPDDYSATKIIPSKTNSIMNGNMVPIVRDGKVQDTGKLSSFTTLDLEVTFKIRHEEQFKNCIQSISDPLSPNYRHFLNSTTLQPYLPTQGQKDSVISFFSQRGFNVTDGPSPLVLKMTAPIGTVEQVLHTKVRLYKNFYAVNEDPSLPTNLSDLLSGMSGLENYTKAVPAESPCSGPYCPQGIQIGYGLHTLYGDGFDGTGQTVAIVDAPGDPNPQTAINTFSTQYNLPPVQLTIQYPNGIPSVYDPGWASEAAMDLDAVHSVAPGAAITLLYCTGDLMDCNDYVANHGPIAKIVSNSWVYCGRCSDTQMPSSLISSIDSRLAIDAARGVTILFASGDYGARPDGTNLGTQFPASDPNVLAVGATNLHLNGCGTITCAGYGTETGALISGGGYSGFFSEPSYQMTAIGKITGRAVPDVSMLGFSPGIWVYSTLSDKCGSTKPQAGWFSCTGTSLATPLWAGFLAVVQQMNDGNGFGNINQKIWKIASNSSYTLDFNDVTLGSNNGYSAKVGWDPVTGWSSPQANNLGFTLEGGSSTFITCSQNSSTGNQNINGCLGTKTTVSPTSPTLGLGRKITFAGIVATINATKTLPNGTLTWSDGGAGGIFSVGNVTTNSCTLSSTNTTPNSCKITYKPSTTVTVGTVITINATYSGDLTHLLSSGTSTLTILRATITTLSPSSSSVVHGTNQVYTVIVTDASSGNKTAPSGAVLWTASKSGGIFASGNCILTSISNSQGECQVTYTAPSMAETLIITGTYGGDGTHAKSLGRATLTVT